MAIEQDTGASADADRAATAAQPSPAVSGKAGIPCASFTPGPWFTGPSPIASDLCVQTVDPLGAWICGQLHNPTGTMPRAVAEANARLIAAAPDLYDTLRRLLHELEWVNEQLDLMPDDYADALTFAQAALRKARGEVSA